MNIDPRKITIREVVNQYKNDEEEGVFGYGGKLSIRPKYQREFVYNDKQRDEVIRTIMHGFPLNVMYWCATDDGTYELLDGQQRTISFCEYVAGSFSVDDKYFGNLPEDQKDQIFDYELFIYVCTGTESEKLEWFKIINIAGEKLTDQELRNAIYAGPWTTDAKRYFSKSGCPAYQLAGDYLKGSSIRQEYLETALKWICDAEGLGKPEVYMGTHQHDTSAVPLWGYFQNVINWTQNIFPNYRSIMKGQDWGVLYNEHKDRKNLDPAVLEIEIKKLLADEDVTNKRGVYEYLLTGNENKLNIRAFSQRDKIAAFERQDGVCPICGQKFTIDEMQADHITPWSRGGKTIPENCQMLCEDCNRRKSNI